MGGEKKEGERDWRYCFASSRERQQEVEEEEEARTTFQIAALPPPLLPDCHEKEYEVVVVVVSLESIHRKNSCFDCSLTAIYWKPRASSFSFCLAHPEMYY